MSYLFYKWLHLTGVFMVLVSVASLAIHAFNGGNLKEHAARRLVGITHGAGLLISLVGGFGLLARLGASMSEIWVLAKLGIWILFGVYTLILKKTSQLSLVHWVVVMGLGSLAAFLAQNKI